MTKIAVYVRVSSGGQDIGSQEPDLQKWLSAYADGQKCIWYRDSFTGKTMDRPGMNELETAISKGEISKLVVWRLDRLGRTAAQVLRFLDELEAKGVGFVSVRDGIDASTASGRLMRTILAGFAEYEREVISERVRAGIDRARAAGKRWGGRKKGFRPRLTRKTLRSVRSLLATGVPKSDVARQLGISRRSVYRAVRILEAA